MEKITLFLCLLLMAFWMVPIDGMDKSGRNSPTNPISSKTATSSSPHPTSSSSQGKVIRHAISSMFPKTSPEEPSSHTQSAAETDVGNVPVEIPTTTTTETDEEKKKRELNEREKAQLEFRFIDDMDAAALLLTKDGLEQGLEKGLDNGPFNN